MKSELLIIGTLPKTAGVGGVTIHIERLMKCLEKDSLKVDLCDYKVVSFVEQIAQIRQHAIIHIHASHPVLRLFYVLICTILLKKSILTIHGNVGRFSRWKNILDKIAIIFCTIPITINKNSYERAKMWNKDCMLMSAFIPPMESEDIPSWVKSWIFNRRANAHEIFCTNASAMSFTNNGEEIYGINFLCEFFQKNQQYSLVVSDPSGSYKEMFPAMSNILFVTGVHSFYEIIKLSDVMIRGTATDGDSLSVKEALYLKKRVIATNRVLRPDGVILYSYNDVCSFRCAIESALRNLNELNSLPENAYNELKKLYLKLQKK